MKLLGRILCWLGLHRWEHRYRPVIRDRSDGAIIDAFTVTYATYSEAKAECDRWNRDVLSRFVEAVVTTQRKCRRCQP